MKTSRILLSSTAALAMLGTSACVTDPNTGERKISRTAIGAGVGGTLGYLLGGAIGGNTARIIGAGIGGSAGAVVGKQFDDQIRELDENDVVQFRRLTTNMRQPNPSDQDYRRVQTDRKCGAHPHCGSPPTSGGRSGARIGGLGWESLDLPGPLG